MFTALISSKGQITLPAALRKQLGVGPGKRVRMYKKGNSMRIEADLYEQELHDLRQTAQAHLVHKKLQNADWSTVKKVSDQKKKQLYTTKYTI